MAFSALRSRAISNSRLPAILIWIWSPSSRPRASTTAEGRRTAKLFPHFATCIDIHVHCISYGELAAVTRSSHWPLPQSLQLLTAGRLQSSATLESEGRCPPHPL